eukprot:1979445-Pleurochrysis_carterae.AAC.1
MEYCNISFTTDAGKIITYDLAPITAIAATATTSTATVSVFAVAAVVAATVTDAAPALLTASRISAAAKHLSYRKSKYLRKHIGGRWFAAAPTEAMLMGGGGGAAIGRVPSWRSGCCWVSAGVSVSVLPTSTGYVGLFSDSLTTVVVLAAGFAWV